jgi:hypothetical protein
MTEDQWLSCDDWRQLIAFLNGRISKRKGTLYICAGLRCIWGLLYDEASREAVEVAERAADGLATKDELRESRYQAESPTFGYDFSVRFLRQFYSDGNYDLGVRRLIEMRVFTEADIREADISEEKPLGELSTVARLSNAAHIAYHCICQTATGIDEHQINHLSKQVEWPGAWLLREVFGNPFRPVKVSRKWLHWKHGTITALARGIYEDRAFDHMPILADALEEASCQDADILDHCRLANRHVRGCWVIDMLLGLQ